MNAFLNCLKSSCVLSARTTNKVYPVLIEQYRIPAKILLSVSFRTRKICTFRNASSLLNRSCVMRYSETPNSNKDFYVASRKFRLSSRRDVNPLVWVVVRPVMKLVAVLTGRGFRKWWKNLPPNKRKYFLSLLKQNKVKLMLILSLIGGSMLYYYESHLQETPITKRKRFMAFNDKQFKVIGEAEFKNICDEYEKHFLPGNHRYTKRVVTVVNRLLQSNSNIEEIREKNWTIVVIDSPMENAFVLPNGQIFVFAGMLNLCWNNDQLAAVLAHEMSHSILAHGAENFSSIHLLDCFLIVIIGAIWAILPSDLLALFTHWLVKQLTEILFELPYNRKIEIEADEVGLNLAAKACFDVRESSAFWSKMAALSSKISDQPEVEFLSTHPSHEKRSAHLDNLMDEALKLRASCGCPSLKTQDPRLDIEKLIRKLEDERMRYRLDKPAAAVSQVPRG